MSSTLTVGGSVVSDVGSFQVLVVLSKISMPGSYIFDAGPKSPLLPCCVYFRVQRNRDRIPGPLTLRMMLREVSSMNSTRTWVTPPREPEVEKNHILAFHALRKVHSFIFKSSRSQLRAQ